MNAHRLIYLDRAELDDARARLDAGDPASIGALNQLVAAADRILLSPPASVMDKTGIAASGDPHDFYAIGAYSWPNPETSDGRPYVYRDSLSNPEATESDEYDKGRYEQMTRHVAAVALAYFYTRDERYAQHGAAILRRWFLDPSSRMNPNFRYAAARPGVHDGHFSGTIEGVFLIEMLDFVALIEDSAHWSAADAAGLRLWFGDLSGWLRSSAFGRREIHSVNNHGSYYLAQVMAFSHFSGDITIAASVIPFAKRQIDKQIAADGTLPYENGRPDGLFYAVYGLRAFAVLASLSEQLGDDLWSYRRRPSDEPPLALAFAALAPYLTGAESWPGRRLNSPYKHYAIQIYRMAARAYGAQPLADVVRALSAQRDEVSEYDALLGAPRTSVNPAARFPVRPTARAAIAATPKRIVALRRKLAQRVKIALAMRGLWINARIR
ncbi:alginate lyase family protein [Microbacterium jiangjiandongii]|uniref:alginate lyase family protein n=1 Tax=Microbacterium jiangjiandongii TaxID=3049071 RepID=UPI00214AC2EF|nr:alginate lyase family protein [Microbacterium sp. zg.Y843]MCR2815873.1 alginate lyase family protein [Microbacterium sp. zg.Y843]